MLTFLSKHSSCCQSYYAMKKFAHNLFSNCNCPTFQDLVAAYEKEDIEKFTEALMDYDSLSPLVYISHSILDIIGCVLCVPFLETVGLCHGTHYAKST